jgi:hypothetical protein
MLKTDWAVSEKKRIKEMGKRINWEAGNSRTKVYLNTDSDTPGWRTILNTYEGIKCSACTRRIKKGQTMLWHIETKIKMHKPQDCKMW